MPVSCPGGCNRAFYCSSDCQTRDWELGHSLECAGIKRLMEELSPEEGLDGYTIDYTWLLLRAIDRYYKKEILSRGESEAAIPNSHKSSSMSSASQHAQLPPALQSTLTSAETLEDLWALCSNASSFPTSKLQNEFSTVGLALSLHIVLDLYPNLPHALKDQLTSPSNILPPCDDPYLTTFTQTLLSNPSLLPSHLHPHLTHLLTLLPAPATTSLLSSTLTLICKEECNSFGTYTFPHPTEPRVGYALSLYPTAVFFNHACAPNVGHTTRHSTMVFYALESVKMGEELCISYIGVSKSPDFETRRRFLKDVFFFECDCERCEVDLGGNVRKDGEEEDVVKVKGKVERRLEMLVCGVSVSKEGQAWCKGYFVPGSLAAGAKKTSKGSEGEGSTVVGRKDSAKALEGGEDVWVCEGCSRLQNI
ncbi:hypothetical protein HDV05_006844 [Chytridiales sp. JEL 0842]|nr:hypothetical protein HDV05_006844 [Chytridiales sp. JEL 0842]